MTKRPANWLFIAIASAALAGCHTYTGAVTDAPVLAPSFERSVSLEPCQDRSGAASGRDLAAEATAALREEMAKSTVFRFSDAPALSFSCDVEGFVEGSALKRWIQPGWGATSARIKVSVWSIADGEIIATFQTKAQVSAGGLYTIGADQYILDVAARDIVGKMEAWASGG